MTREQFQPREVHKIEETGLSNGMLTELCLKHIFFEGQALLRTLADRTKLAALGAIAKTADYVPNKFAARFKWLVGEGTGVA